MISTILLMQALPLVTLSQVMQLAPAKVGDLVLDGQEHGLVEAVAPSQARGLELPGNVELYLVEQASAHQGLCSRRRWTATFHYGPSETKNAAKLTALYSNMEVALPQTGTCPTGQYIRLNPGIDSKDALRPVTQLEKVRLGQLRVHFSCTDSTSSHLCADDRTIQHELAAISPWALTREGDTMVFWLGTPGEVVTEVRFDPASPQRLTVSRRVPPPA